MVQLFLLLSTVYLVAGIHQSPLADLMVQQGQETVNMDPGIVLSLGTKLQSVFQQKFDNYTREVEAKIAKLESMCQSAYEIEPEFKLSEDDDKKVEGIIGDFVHEMLKHTEEAVQRVKQDMLNNFQDSTGMLDSKIASFQTEVSDLKDDLSYVVDMVTHLQDELGVLDNVTTNQIKEEMRNLPTTEELKNHTEQLGNQLGEVILTVENATRSCGSSIELQEVMEDVAQSRSDIQELSQYLRDNFGVPMCEETFDEIIAYIQKLMQTMNESSQSVSDLDTRVLSMQGDFQENLDNLERIAKDIAEQNLATNTTLKPTEVTEEEEPECRNSQFQGIGRNLNLCEAAVRFKKCYLEFIAFHCCKSCREAGLLTSAPKYKASRDVSVMQALKSLRP